MKTLFLVLVALVFGQADSFQCVPSNTMAIQDQTLSPKLLNSTIHSKGNSKPCLSLTRLVVAGDGYVTISLGDDVGSYQGIAILNSTFLRGTQLRFAMGGSLRSSAVTVEVVGGTFADAPVLLQNILLDYPGDRVLFSRNLFTVARKLQISDLGEVASNVLPMLSSEEWELPRQYGSSTTYEQYWGAAMVLASLSIGLRNMEGFASSELQDSSVSSSSTEHGGDLAPQFILTSNTFEVTSGTVSQAEPTKGGQSYMMAAIFGLLCGQRQGTSSCFASWIHSPVAPSLDGISELGAGTVIVQQNQFLTTTYDSAHTTVFYFPPGKTVLPSSTLISNNTFRTMWKNTSVIKLNAFDRTPIPCDSQMVRSFFYFGLTPAISESTLPQSFGEALLNLTSGFQLSGQASFTISANNFEIGSEGDQPGIGLIQTRSYVFYSPFPRWGITGRSNFLFHLNNIDLSGGIHTFVFYLTATPPDGYVYSLRNPFLRGDLVTISQGSRFAIEESTLNLDAAVFGFSHDGSTSFGAAGLFHIGMFDVARWTSEVHHQGEGNSGCDPDVCGTNRTLLVTGESTFRISNLSSTIKQIGYSYQWKARGVHFDLHLGYSKVDSYSGIEVIDSDIQLVTSEGGLGGSTPLFYPGCSSVELPRVNFAGAVPTARIYTSTSDLRVESNSKVQMKDKSITVLSGFQVQVLTMSQNQFNSATGVNVLAVEDTWLLKVEGKSKFELCPQSLDLVGLSQVQAVNTQGGWHLAASGSTINFLSCGNTGGSANPLKLRMTWVRGPSEPVSFFSSYNCQMSISGGSKMMIMGNGTSGYLFSRKSMAPVDLSTNDLPVAIPYYVTDQSSFEMFTTYDVIDATTNKIASAKVPNLVFERPGNANTVNLIYFGNQIFVHLNSTLSMFHGVNVTMDMGSPGAGIYIYDTLAVEVNSNLTISLSNFTTTGTGTNSATAVLRLQDEMNFKFHALMSLVNLRAIGLGLLLVSSNDRARSDSFHLSYSSSVTIADSYMSSGPGLLSAVAISWESSEFYMSKRSQLLIWSLTVEDAALLKLSTRTDAGVKKQSSIMITRNQVSGPNMLELNTPSMEMDNTSAITIQENVCSNSSVPSLLSIGTSGSDINLENPIIARCNYFVGPDDDLHLFGDSGEDDSSSKKPVVSTPGRSSSSTSSSTNSSLVLEVGCDDECSSPGSLDPNIVPVYCSPIGMKFDEYWNFPDVTGPFVAPLSEPMTPPRVELLATYSRLQNSTKSCICSPCSVSTQRDYNGEGSLNRVHFTSLAEPYCAPEVIEWLNETEELPVVRNPSGSSKSPVSKTIIYVGAGLGCALVLLLVLAGLQQISARKQKARFASELEKALVPLVELSELTEWPNKPTALTFRKGKLIGSGGFGRVYVGLDDASGRLLAAKEVSLAEDQNPEKQARMLGREIALMKRLSHRNVVQYLGADKASETELYIFMEFLPGGSLRSVIGNYGRLNQRVAANYTKQALKGLAYLHGQGVVHRDIKAANMLLDKEGVVKLADMGCAQNIETVQSMRGTPLWMAPEVVRVDTGLIGPPSDVWSIGCTVIEMLTGKMPWEWVGSAFVVMRTIADGGERLEKAWETMPKEVLESIHGLDFIKKCCTFDPSERWSAKQLLNHPFVTTVYEDSTLNFDTRSRSSGESREGSPHASLGGGRMNDSQQVSMISMTDSLGGVSADEMKTGFGLTEEEDDGHGGSSTLLSSEGGGGTMMGLSSSAGNTGSSSLGSGPSQQKRKESLSVEQQADLMNSLLQSLRDGIISKQKEGKGETLEINLDAFDDAPDEGTFEPPDLSNSIQ